MGESAAKLEPIESPCIDVCRLDEQGLCVGCFRTAAEIGAWLTLEPSQRREIIESLPERAGSMFGDL